ncbi:MAG: hypothetical protein ABIT08_00840 [Bacteroidia bacterium]
MGFEDYQQNEIENNNPNVIIYFEYPKDLKKYLIVITGQFTERSKVPDRWDELFIRYFQRANHFIATILKNFCNPASYFYDIRYVSDFK